MINFLKKDTILTFHQDQLERYGGKAGIRDEKLLESALAQPEASFEGKYVHKDLFHMAAAYGFHLCYNHPFYDGNKRTALIVMYTFHYVNGYQIVADKKSLFAIMMDLANGRWFSLYLFHKPLCYLQLDILWLFFLLYQGHLLQ